MYELISRLRPGAISTRIRRTAATLAVVATVAGGSAGLAAAPAMADTASYNGLTSTSNWYSLDVSGASTSLFAPIDVWYYNGNANQQFTYPENNGQVAEIEAQNSGMCITTDGTAGDVLFQAPCFNGVAQQWEAETWTAWWNPGKTMVTFLNPWSGLVMDVENNSYSPGASVDGWYPNGGLNQSWTLPACDNEYLC